MFDFLLRSGIFFYTIPWQLLLILLGIFIVKLLKTSRGRRLWLGVEIITLIVCEIIPKADIMLTLTSYFFYVLAFDLLIGHGIVGMIRGFRWLVDWLNKENAENEEESQ